MSELKNREPGLSIVENTDDVAKWHQGEEKVLVEKLAVAKQRPPTLEEKIEQWRSLNDKQKKRKCLSRLKAVFRKPSKIMLKLQIRGDDVISAAEEGLQSYRITKIIDNYGKVRDKILDAIEVAKEYNDTFPDAAQAVGGFEWHEEIPKVLDEDGFLNIWTKDGLRRAKTDGDDKPASSA